MITQSAVTVMAEIQPGHELMLRQLLEDAARDPVGNLRLAFQQLANVHFARFFVLEAARDYDGRILSPRLIFLADVDGQSDAFLLALVSVAHEALDALFAHCQDYSGTPGLVDFLRRHRIPTAAKYVNTIGRTVQQIRQESTLHQVIQQFLDRSPDRWRGANPHLVRAAIRECVEAQPTLSWARQPVPPPHPLYVLGEKLHFALAAAAVGVLSPVVLLGLPAWLYSLREHEHHDALIVRDVMPDDALLDALRAQEDHGVQNPLTSAGFVKPGRFRRFTASLVLWAINLLARHIYNHGQLMGVKTIHFARWLSIDEKRRVIFASNYDGSLENYMDDFIDKIAWGLNATFSNGVNFPNTNWLILGGAHAEQPFKRFNFNNQLVAPFWYSAYQGLTTLDIDNNAEIRAGLYGPMDTPATLAWLRRL